MWSSYQNTIFMNEYIAMIGMSIRRQRSFEKKDQLKSYPKKLSFSVFATSAAVLRGDSRRLHNFLQPPAHHFFHQQDCLQSSAECQSQSLTHWGVRIIAAQRITPPHPSHYITSHHIITSHTYDTIRPRATVYTTMLSIAMLYPISIAYSRRRRVSLLLILAFAFVIKTVSGFVPVKSAPNCLVAAHSSRRDTKQYISPSFTPNALDLLAYDNDASHQGSMSPWTKTKHAVTNLFPKSRKKQEEEDYQRRKKEWVSQYTDVVALRKLFGENRNKLWGDLDAGTCRRLYKTLLPKALLEMHKVGVRPEDLAPLAYKARLAAKLYARERGVVPARLLAATFDGFRQWKRYGKFQTTGMTYPQVWDKYESMILEELGDKEDLADEDVTAKICLKILERSCATNEGIDRWLLPHNFNAQAMKEHERDLTAVIDQLERDVHELLQPTQRAEAEWKASRIRTLRLLVRAKRRLDKLQPAVNEDESSATSEDRVKKHNHRQKKWERREEEPMQ
jgi:hypothetical protein